MSRAGPILCAALLAVLLALAAPAWAAESTHVGKDGSTTVTAAEDLLDKTADGDLVDGATPVPSGLPDTPSGYKVDAAAALSAADSDPKIQDLRDGLDKDEYVTASLSAEAVNVWEVGYFVSGDKTNLVVVDGISGEVRESWTGSAVNWPMARGHEGQFGHLLNAPWVWGPLAAIFLLALFDYRRWRKWVHLDLLVLLSFGISQAFFNAAEIGVAVPLYYPPLVYLLLRMLWIGFRGAGSSGGAGEGLRPSAPRWLLIGLAIGLIAVRIAGNVADSGVIDVGYAGVIGADKITDAQPIYGDESFPENNRSGDTYGPANYFAYVPFEEVLPWSGLWDDLPAAHAASITFDLATILGLYALGGVMTRRRREDGMGSALTTAEEEELGPDLPPRTPDDDPAAGRLVRARSAVAAWLRARSPHQRTNTLGLVLVFAWVAYPYSAFALQSNSNDSLVAALLVWSLVLFAVPLARGALLATAGLAKFAPLALFPLYAAGWSGIRLRTPDARHALLRPLALFAAAFVVASLLLIAHPAVDPGLAAFYDRTIKSQVDRVSPFSIWGQADIEWLHTLVKVGAIGLALLVAFVPKQRSLPQIAALAAAVIIAIQLTLQHWFYLYIPWFLPMLLLAVAVSRPAPEVGETNGAALSRG